MVISPYFPSFLPFSLSILQLEFAHALKDEKTVYFDNLITVTSRKHMLGKRRWDKLRRLRECPNDLLTVYDKMGSKFSVTLFHPWITVVVTYKLATVVQSFGEDISEG